MFTLVCVVFVVLTNLSYAANADQMNSTAALSSSIQSRDFEFITGSNSPEHKQTGFCLPSGERLLKVVDATVEFSNVHVDVNVKGDIEANCVSLDFVLPAARQICTAIPAPTFLDPRKMRSLCTSVPTTVKLVVHYESQTVDPKAIPR